MNAYLDKQFYSGFFISEENVIKIHDIIKNRVQDHGIEDEILYKLYRKDALVFETENYQELIDEENSQRNKINKLEILINHDQLEFNLTFDKKENTNIEIEATDKDFVYLLYSDLKEYLNTEILKFRSFNFSDSIFDRLFPIVVVFLMMTFSLFQIGDSSLSEIELNNLIESGSSDKKINAILTVLNGRKDPSALWIQMPIMIGAFIVLYFSIKNLDKLYPRNIFYWGKEIKKYDRITGIRSKIVWGIIITFVVGTLSSLVVYALT